MSVMKFPPQALDLDAWSPALDFGSFRRWAGLHWNKQIVAHLSILYLALGS